MKKVNPLFIGTITSAIYLIIYLLFNDAPVYIVGGMLGTAIKLTGTSVNLYILVPLWVSLLTLLIVFVRNARNLVLINLTFVLEGILLYVVDFLYYNVVTYGSNMNMTYLGVAITILLKSIIFTYIYYFCSKRNHAM